MAAQDRAPVGRPAGRMTGFETIRDATGKPLVGSGRSALTDVGFRPTPGGGTSPTESPTEGFPRR